MSTTPPGDTGIAALVVAHPAHELRLHAWIEAARPTVFVLTDGAGRDGRPRINRTERIVRDLGARRGSVFGDLTDRAVYASLLAGDHDALLRTADRLAEGFVRSRVDTVVVDAREDAFLSHDVLNALVRAAVLTASSRLGRPIACYDFVLEAEPTLCPPGLRDAAIWLRLTPEQVERKLATAWSYHEVRSEVEKAFTQFGHDAFAVECLRPLAGRWPIPPPERKPRYESHGEEMVREGLYRRVVRFDDHVAPLLQRLADHAPLALGITQERVA